jgi:hypothetical protein
MYEEAVHLGVTTLSSIGRGGGGGVGMGSEYFRLGR